MYCFEVREVLTNKTPQYFKPLRESILYRSALLGIVGCGTIVVRVTVTVPHLAQSQYA